MLIIDASAFASWAFPDERTEHVSQALLRVMTGEEPASSAPIFPLEAMYAAGRALHCGRFTPEVHQHVLRLLSRLPVALSPLRIAPIEFWPWARALNLTAYDASYLRVAIDARAPLVTMDAALAAAAREIGHPLITDLT